MLCHNAPTLSRLNTSSHLSRNKPGTLVTRGVWGAERAVFCFCPLPPALPSAHAVYPLPHLVIKRSCSRVGHPLRRKPACRSC